LVVLLLSQLASAQQEVEQAVDVYFFWANGCPHCTHEKPFLKGLSGEYPWLVVHSYEVTGNLDNAHLFEKMAAECGEPAQAVPATIICDQMVVGYGSDEVDGKKIKELILACYEKMQTEHVHDGQCTHEPVGDTTFEIPGIGSMDAQDMSLPLLTVVLGGLDGFNPCAFFVLFFLLSLLIHAKSRARMALIGGIFVFFSGLIYFIFMAAWLNFFLIVGNLELITTVAGIIALIVGIVNIKDFFWFKRGLSMSIPESAKPKLFTRMRGLIKATELPSMILGSAVLAIAANAYELLCTAGFPMVYARVLTLSELSGSEYYMYLALYNIVYVMPLSVIVIAFTWTLGARKLKQSEGESLKLLSGNMMTALGVLLVAAPELLGNIAAAVGLLALSVMITAVLTFIKSRARRVDEKGD